MVKSDLVFKAIAHPARREILALLSVSTRSVKELTAEFSMSQPAVSQHLRELRGARLVASERVGLEHRYRLTAAPLRVVLEWSAQYRRFFDPAGHAWALVATEAPAKKEKASRNPVERDQPAKGKGDTHGR
jgi:DNA-binding transcriptional ArsR family regulator